MAARPRRPLFGGPRWVNVGGLDPPGAWTMRPLTTLLATLAVAACSGAAGDGSTSADAATGSDTEVEVVDTDASATDTTVEPPEADADATPSLDAGGDTAAPSDAAVDAAPPDVAVDTGDRDAQDAETSDTADGSDVAPDVAADGGGAIESPHVERIVVAGDSWSTGAVRPLIGLLPDRGFADVVVTYETTALAGSQAREWVANHEGKLDALDAALDAAPVAEVLLLFIGGNDFNFAMLDAGWSQRRRDRTIDEIEGDIETLVRHALDGRPWLTVVLMDYSWFNYPKMRAVYGFDIAPNLADFNDAYVRMGERKRAIAGRVEGVAYAHHFGVLQHAWGDVEQVYPFEPYVVPAYEPGFFEAPGMAPDYLPWPGGNAAFPGPTEALFDGLHLTDEAMRVLLDHTLAQGLGPVLRGADWAPESP